MMTLSYQLWFNKDRPEQWHVEWWNSRIGRTMLTVGSDLCLTERKLCPREVNWLAQGHRVPKNLALAKDGSGFCPWQKFRFLLNPRNFPSDRSVFIIPGVSLRPHLAAYADKRGSRWAAEWSPSKNPGHRSLVVLPRLTVLRAHCHTWMLGQ